VKVNTLDAWPVTDEFDGLRKHLVTEHGVLDADELPDALAAAEHYSQHYSPDGKIPPKGTWGHHFSDLSYNQDIDLEV
jgi:hypothetical protein